MASSSSGGAARSATTANASTAVPITAESSEETGTASATTNATARASTMRAVRSSDGRGFASFVKTNDDVAAAVLEVEGVGVALGAEAQDGQGFVLEMFQVGVFVGINFGGHNWNGEF